MPRKEIGKSLAGSALVIYFLLLIYWMFFGFSRTPGDNYMYNLIPFATIKNYVTYFDHFNFTTWIINILGNIGVFVPFGLLLPIYYRQMQNFFTFTFLFLIGITILETIQVTTRRGSFDVDDVILNSIGALIGFFLLKSLRK